MAEADEEDKSSSADSEVDSADEESSSTAAAELEDTEVPAAELEGPGGIAARLSPSVRALVATRQGDGPPLEAVDDETPSLHFGTTSLHEASRTFEHSTQSTASC